MHIRAIPRVRLAAVIAAVALAVGACGTPAGDVTTSTAETSPTSTTPVPDTSSPSPGGGTLTAAWPQQLLSLDPVEFPADAQVITMAEHVYDPLVRYDGVNFVPALATEWELLDDTTWTFTLREGVSFHDGSPLTSEDVKASLERFYHDDVTGPTHGIGLWGEGLEVEATNASTVTIRLSQPLGTVLLAASRLYILPADGPDEDGFFSKPIGTGGFHVDSYVADDHLHLTRNEAYWDGAPDLERLEFKWIPEISSRMTALRAGEVDVLWNIPPDQVSSIEGRDGIEYGTSPGYTYYFVWFNASRPPFDDARVRRAMWHAIDLDTTIRDLFGDLGEVARAPITQSVFGAPALEPYTYDPELAMELLAEAGYPDGLATTIQWGREAGPNINALGTSFGSFWNAIGVDVELLEKERADYVAALADLDAWDMSMQTNSTVTGDADWTLGRLYVCSANRTGYCNPDLDALLLAAKVTVDLDERRSLYEQASQILWDDAVGIFPVDLQMNAAWGSHVQGFEVPAAAPQFHRVTLDR